MRTFTQNVRTFLDEGNSANENLKVLFQNAVCWLVRCRACSAIDVGLEATVSAAQIEVGQTLRYDLTLQHSGECEATGVVVTNKLTLSALFLGAESAQGTCNFDPIANTVTFSLGHLAKVATVRLSLTVAPRQAGVLTNIMNLRVNGPEARSDNNTSVVVTAVTESTRPVLSITRTVDGQPETRLQGKAGTSYVVEASTNLVRWTTFTNVVATKVLLRFPETAVPKFKARYYRARQEP